jgi:hypothetical protein
MPKLCAATTTKGGLRAVTSTMLAQKTTILNHFEPSNPDFATWFDHFPVKDGACEYTFNYPVFRFTSYSSKVRMRYS